MRVTIGLIRLIRPLNGLIAVLTLFVATWLISGMMQFPVMEAVSLFLIVSFGFIVNDIFDYRSDQVSKPKRVLPAGLVSCRQAIVTAVTCLLLGFGAAGFTTIPVIVYSLLLSLMLFLYAYKLSSVLIVSNIVVAVLCSSVFFLGWLISEPTGDYLPLLLAAMLFVFLYHLGREILKDIEDVEGDMLAGRQTIPLVLGQKAARIICASVFTLLIFSTYILYFVLQLNLAFLFVVTLSVNIPIVIIFLALVFKEGSEQIKKASNMLKLVILPGMVALVIAGFNNSA